MNNEVTTTKNAVPAHLQGQTNSGFIEDDSSLLSTPRLKLIQKSSGEFDEGLAKGGEFFNTVTRLASPEAVFTPIKGHTEYVNFDDDGNMTFRSESEAEAKRELGEDYWKARRINFLILPYASEIPVVYSFSGKGYKMGQKLYQLCKVANPSCMFSKAYKLTNSALEGAGGKYWVPNVAVAKDLEGYADSQGWLTEDAFNIAREIAETV